MLKYKNKKGEEIEIEETEVIKAVQEEYEKKLTAKDEEIKKQKEAYEKQKQELREEHVKQMRAILTGRKETGTEKPEFEETEENEEEKMLKDAKDIFQKII